MSLRCQSTIHEERMHWQVGVKDIIVEACKKMQKYPNNDV